MYFKDLKKIVDMFTNNNPMNYDYVPTNYLGKTTTESGTKDGYNWYKNTFTSNDGTYTQTTYYKSKGNTWFNEAIEELTNNRNTRDEDTKSTIAGKSYSDRVTILRTELEEAIKGQKFEEAVRLRDEINAAEKNNVELESLKAELETLIAEYNFEKAIEVRDKIKSIEG